MIIGNQKIQDVIIEGESNVKVAGISTSKLHKLQYMLTQGLYSDTEGAVIVELTNNGQDSIVTSGKDPILNPVVVKLEKNERGSYQLSIEDKGLGMDKDFFENTFMSFLESTKEQDNDVIGSYGIG